MCGSEGIPIFLPEKIVCTLYCRHIESFYDKIVKNIIIKIKCIVSYFFRQLVTESEAFKCKDYPSRH